jgi:predicted dehydrogenase
MSLKVAIVGCGKIADGHAEAIKRTRGLGKLVAACDLELLMAEQFAVRFGVPSHYDDFDKMLDRERPDVVHITTPPGSHLTLAKKAMDAGAHAFVEKPLALNHPDSKAIVDYAERTGKKLTIGWEFFFDPPALALRELVASGVVGEPVHVESSYGFDRSGPFGNALLRDESYWVHKLPGKLFHNVIDHLLNKSLEWVDDDDPAVTAFAYTRRRERYGDVRDHMLDELRLVIRGARTTAYGTFSAEIQPPGHFLRLYGTKNTVHVDYNMRTVVLEASPKWPSAIGRVVPAFREAYEYLREGGKNVMTFAKSDFHYFAGMRTLVTRFYESIVNGAPLPISYRDMNRVSKMMDEIFRQVPQDGGAS